MGTTSNYNWPYPEATGLVKDGWEDIKDLATAIDTTAAASFAGGLVLLKTYTPSAVSSISLDANTFTSTYRNYKILVSNVNTSTNGDYIGLRLRASGTDTTTNTYERFGYINVNAGSIVGARATATYWYLGLCSNSSAYGNFFVINVSNINAVARTMIAFTGMNQFASGSTENIGANGFQTDTTQFDSMTFFAGAANLSATIQVFAYKQ